MHTEKLENGDTEEECRGGSQPLPDALAATHAKEVDVLVGALEFTIWGQVPLRPVDVWVLQ